VAIERRRKRAPRRGRLDEVRDRVGAPQPPGGPDPHRDGRHADPGSAQLVDEQGVAHAPPERGAEREQDDVGHRVATSASARA
jgi:hypothetical protein